MYAAKDMAPCTVWPPRLALAWKQMIEALGTTTLQLTWIHQLAEPNGGTLAIEATGKCFTLANAGGVVGIFSTMASPRCPSFVVGAVSFCLKWRQRGAWYS
jgi:hypothetical protein